jgi:hypothetical protein
MKILASLLGAAAISGLPVPTGVASADVRFDLITYDHIQLDFQTVLGFGASYGLLVNTGTEPIDLANWKDALHVSLISAPIGELDLYPVNPITGFVLQPGQAIGSGDPLLTALLQPGEVLAQPGIVLSLQMKGPVPIGTTQTLDFCVQLYGQSVTASTQVDFVGAGGPAITPLSAVRVAAGLPKAALFSLESGCPGQLDPWPDAPGSPHDAGASSDLPVVGNTSFGVRVGQTAPNLYVIGIDFDGPPLTYAGCTIWLGLTQSLSTKAGVLDPGGFDFVHTPIPDQAALVGAGAVLQAAFIDAVDGGFSGLSNALGLVIGSCP